MTNSKRKGKNGELELAAKLRDLGFNTRRGQQYNGLEGEDVVGMPGIHLECKRHKQPTAIQRWIDQSANDACEAVPVVCHRADRKEWLLTIKLDDVMQMARTLTLCHDTFRSIKQEYDG